MFSFYNHFKSIEFVKTLLLVEFLKPVKNTNAITFAIKKNTKHKVSSKINKYM